MRVRTDTFTLKEQKNPRTEGRIAGRGKIQKKSAEHGWPGSIFIVNQKLSKKWRGPQTLRQIPSAPIWRKVCPNGPRK